MTTYSIISIIICLFITIIYNGYIIIKYQRIPKSLSETSYILGGNKRYFFTLYCFLVIACLLPTIFMYTPSTWQFIPFIFSGGFLFAGFSPLFLKGLDKKVHYPAAYISFAAYFFYMILCMNWWWVLGFLITFFILILWKRSHYVYFAEMTSVIEIIIYLLTLC